MARALRNGAVTIAALLVLLAATGWLYLIRPQVGSLGPRLPLALPLDELANRAALPLLVFLGVWGAAGLMLGLLARAARLERLTAALVLAVGVGTFEFLALGVSLAIVRQVPLHEAFHSAASARVVYAPSVLAALGGAICGRARMSARSRMPLVLAWGVAAAGALGLADALLPSNDGGFLSSFAPDAVKPITSALVGPLALALLVTARGLARRKRRAWQVALVLLGGSTVLHVLHGFHAGAAATALLAVGLVAHRHQFDALGDPTSRPRLALRAALVVAAIFLYGALALWLSQIAIDQPVSLSLIAHETGAALVGLRLRGTAHVPATVDSWFPLSVFLAGLAGGAWLLFAWIGPWRYRHRQEARERALARELVAAWGADTLAPFALRADKSYFFSEDDRAFLAYRVVRAWQSSPATRSARPHGTAPSSTVSWRSPASAAGGSRSSVLRSPASSSTGSAGCTRSTTATRPSWKRRPSRSRVGRSGRCGSRCTGSGGRGTARRSCGPLRSARRCGRSSRRSRGSGGGESRSAAS
jgi:lysylphosphatidylglycerol synthetase-like protein (DUF2156 family)